MGLRSAFQKAALAATKAAGDIVETAQYFNVVSTVYDTSSGTASAIAYQHATEGIFSRFEAAKIDDEKILPTDVKFIVPQLGFLPDQPSTKDYVSRIEAEASITYDVVNFEEDPAGAIFIFQLRRT